MEAPESNPYCTVDCELEEEPLLLPGARGDVKVPPRGLRRVELEVQYISVIVPEVGPQKNWHYKQ